MSETLPLILTLKLDAQSFSYFNQLRRQHFPVERNFLPAHITLFHALPGEQLTSIQQTLQQVCAQIPAFPIAFPSLRFLGQGIAVEVSSAELIQLHQQLAKQWQGWLSRQDQQKYRPHAQRGCERLLLRKRQKHIQGA